MFALVEREGRAFAFPVGRVDVVRCRRNPQARSRQLAHDLDELHAYNGLSMGFASHETIKHSELVYAKGIPTHYLHIQRPDTRHIAHG